MNKSPAFQFYPQDYLSSARVAEMTLEEEGVYIRLLCYCWSSGSIPADPERCARLAGKGCSVEVATTVQRSFNEAPTNCERLVHDRLEIERNKQQMRREQASAAGKLSGQSRRKTSKTPAKTAKSNGRSTDVQRNSNTSSSSSSSSSSSESNSKEKDLTDAFNTFWQTYPRRVGKGKAQTAFRSATKRAGIPRILQGASDYAEDCEDGLRTGRIEAEKFIPHPATWLNGDRWDDDRASKASGAGKIQPAVAGMAEWLRESIAAIPDGDNDGSEVVRRIEGNGDGVAKIAGPVPVGGHSGGNGQVE